MELQYWGHSCFTVTVNRKRLLFDPFISQNPLAAAIRLEDIKADYIFLSHAHFDHIDDAMKLVSLTGATLVCGWELYLHFKKQGLSAMRPMNPGGKSDFEFGRVFCVTAQHSSSLPDGSYGGMACGFVIHSREGCFYYSGDTALTGDMKRIGDWGALDFAVLPIGDLLTMGAEEALLLAQWLGLKQVVGVHYDTFEFIRIDHEKTKRLFEDAGVQLHLVPIGSSVQLPVINRPGNNY